MRTRLRTVKVSLKGTTAAEWDKHTWPVLEELARNHPEAGVHFQGPPIASVDMTERANWILDCKIYNRLKDVGSSTAEWFAGLLSQDPWWKRVVPNVSFTTATITYWPLE